MAEKKIKRMKAERIRIILPNETSSSIMKGNFDIVVEERICRESEVDYEFLYNI